MGQTERGLSVENGWTTLNAVASMAGLDLDGADLIRLGENALFTLPSERVVVRIARSAQVERVETEVRVARWLAEQGYPAVRVAERLPQPVTVDGRLVTFWDLIDISEGQVATYADLGRMLRAFHDLPAPSFPLPEFDPFTAVPARLAAPPAAASAEDVAFLVDLHTRLRAAYDSLAWPTPPGVIHGDAYRNNLIPARDGAVLLSDFELVAHGPREWDLAVNAMATERFGVPEQDYRAFADAYGRDVRDWDGYPVLRGARELTTVSWLLQITGHSPDLAAEFARRVTSIREGDWACVWRVI